MQLLLYNMFQGFTLPTPWAHDDVGTELQPNTTDSSMAGLLPSA